MRLHLGAIVKLLIAVLFGFATAASLHSLALANTASVGEVRVAAAAVELRATDDMVIAGSIGPVYVKGQDGPLRAVATVIQGPLDGARVAIVALDVTSITREYLDATAMEIEQKTGIPFDHIIINSTHTHHAPAVRIAHGYGPDLRFVAQVKTAVIDSVVNANSRLPSSPRARAFFAMGREATVGQNSRIEMRDGTIAWIRFTESEQLHATGPFDPDFPVLTFKRPDGGLSAVIFGHSTHTIGTRNPGRRSPAFYGLAAQEFERQTGAVTTFIEGASGSTHLLEIDGVSSSQLPIEAERRVLNALRYYVDQAQEVPVSRIGSLKREIVVQVRNFDEEKEEQTVRAYCKKANCDQVFGHDKTVEIFRQERADLAPYRGEKRKTWISATRIGDIAIVGIPAELFTQLGLEIKQRSPFPNTFIAELANDTVGYVGSAEDYRLGGYQLWMGHHSWTERGTGELFVDEAVKLLNDLHVR